MNVLAMLMMNPSQVVAHLTPIARLSQVEKLHIVRPTRVRFPADNIVWHDAGPHGRLSTLLRMHRTADRVLATEPIDYVVAINPVPYGLMAWRLAKRWRKPISISLIGNDYYDHCHAWYGPLLRGVLRRCDAVTGTGQKMVESFRAWGVPQQAARVLPHSLDLARFQPRTPLAARPYDAVCCGKLIHRKRVDLVIRAFAQVLESHPQAKLAIVGDGPLRADLESLASALGARSQIDFVGEQPRVERFYDQARVFLLTSDMEGLPYAMLEAMSCGCVPICTRCGTIEDVLVDGTNGFLVERDDWQSVARRTSELLADRSHLEALSQAALAEREHLDWDSAERVWQAAFEQAA